MLENLETKEQKNKRKNYFSFVFLFLGLIVIDQFSKHLINSPFLNYEFAFSIYLPKFLIYLIYILVVIGIGVYNYKNFFHSSLIKQIAWTIILAGAISNIAERVIFGFVKDFIYIHLFNLTGIYNLADFYILGGIILLLIF